MSKLTKEQIESLGFRFNVKNEEDDSNYTFSKQSLKKNWVDLIVWHPKEDWLTISHHVSDLAKYLGPNKTKTTTNVNKIIYQVFNGDVKSLKELETICKEHKII